MAKILNGQDSLAKVPAITLGFWIIKILATTLGETGGDFLSMSLGLGYLPSTVIFSLIFLVAIFFQIRAEGFHPSLYWLTIITTTTLGTTLADFTTRSIGIGYLGGSTILLSLVLASLGFWKKCTGSIAVDQVSNTKSEWFYWLTIMFSQTLGTAAGDWTADTLDCGYLGSIGIFGGLLFIIALLYWRTAVSHVLLFWAAFILTRPLGAVVGDFLDKPLDHGGLNLSRLTASLIIAALMIVSGFCFPQRAATRTH
jgi:uncharacterized membrane-anchored protein